MNPQSVKCLTHSQQLSCGAGALIKGWFAPVLAVKADYIRLLVLFLPVSYAMPMRRNEVETAAHGCHYLGDTAVSMPDRGLVF